jgi:hypothetical protein
MYRLVAYFPGSVDVQSVAPYSIVEYLPIGQDTQAAEV